MGPRDDITFGADLLALVREGYVRCLRAQEDAMVATVLGEPGSLERAFHERGLRAKLRSMQDSAARMTDADLSEFLNNFALGLPFAALALRFCENDERYPLAGEAGRFVGVTRQRIHERMRGMYDGEAQFEIINQMLFRDLTAHIQSGGFFGGNWGRMDLFAEKIFFQIVVEKAPPAKPSRARAEIMVL
jgi:hypothetical protein